LREFDLGTFAFLTCTNTLGNSLLFGDQVREAREEPAFGGLAGEALHALALVTSSAGVARMRNAGAAVVGAATLLGKEGVGAFEVLTAGLSD
jgi:dihydroorotate dehydrogenase (fumarate)